MSEHHLERESWYQPFLVRDRYRITEWLRSGKSGPASPLKQDYVEPLAQNHILVAFEYLQGGTAHSFSGNLCQFLAHGGECHNRGMMQEKKSSNTFKPPFNSVEIPQFQLLALNTGENVSF